MLENNLTESEQLERLKGHRVGPYLSYNPVSATQIWLWCSAMGDNNPRYLPGEEQIAPPAMMQMWTMRDINDRSAPGSTEAAQYQVFDEMKALGYPANVAVSYDINFHRHLKPGDRAKHYSTVVNISDRKTTALGTGFFVTERVEYLTAEDQLFAEALISYFQYLPPEPATADPEQEETDQAAKSRAETKAQEPPAVAPGSWNPDFVNIDPGKVSVGDTLPPLVLPITHKLIVGGAMATQDFIPVHHNVPEAQAAGMSDIFMNILTTSGLSARYIGDWAGADSVLKQLSFKLLSPNFPGDTMVMEGQVTAVSLGESAAEISVAFGGRNALGYHTRGTATVAVPVTTLTQQENIRETA
jgi:acyl dehydratase